MLQSMESKRIRCDLANEQEVSSGICIEFGNYHNVDGMLPSKMANSGRMFTEEVRSEDSAQGPPMLRGQGASG